MITWNSPGLKSQVWEITSARSTEPTYGSRPQRRWRRGKIWKRLKIKDMENRIARNSSVIRTDLAKWGSTCFELLVTCNNSHQLNECMHQRRPNWYMNLCVHNRSPRLSYRNPRLKLSLMKKMKIKLSYVHQYSSSSGSPCRRYLQLWTAFRFGRTPW